MWIYTILQNRKSGHRSGHIRLYYSTACPHSPNIFTVYDKNVSCMWHYWSSLQVSMFYLSDILKRETSISYDVCHIYLAIHILSFFVDILYFKILWHFFINHSRSNQFRTCCGLLYKAAYYLVDVCFATKHCMHVASSSTFDGTTTTWQAVL